MALTPSLNRIEGAPLECTEREALQRELDDALRAKKWTTGWLLTVGFGPAAGAAVMLAWFVEESRGLALGFAAMGSLVLGLRLLRMNRRIRQIEQALDDPMDGS